MHLLVAVEVLIDAGAAARAVFARETIEQALVAFAPVAVAIAGLLVKRFLDLRGNGVGVLHHEIRKTLRIHGFRQLALGSLRMVGRDSLAGFWVCFLRRAAGNRESGAFSPRPRRQTLAKARTYAAVYAGDGGARDALAS